MPAIVPHLRNNLFIIYLLSDIYYRKCYKPNVLWGSASYKIDQRPFTVHMLYKKLLTGPARRLLHSRTGMKKENQPRHR